MSEFSKIKRVLLGGSEVGQRQRKRCFEYRSRDKGDMMVEVEVRVMTFEERGRSHEPEKVDRL